MKKRLLITCKPVQDQKLPSQKPISRPSATVVVARDGAHAPELLLVRRRAGDAFGDSYTFPGGVVDRDETAAHRFCSGMTVEEANRELAVTDGGLDYFSAAIRELFEETGILLARRDDGAWAEDGRAFTELRRRVDKGDIAWADFLREQGLCMAADALHYFAWWETPSAMPKRWTTRFFVAELPPGQCAAHDGHEVTDHRWLSAKAAISLVEDGAMPMPFPTLCNLESLQAFQSVAALIDWAHRLPKADIGRIEPCLVTANGRKVPVVPGDARYPHREKP